MQGSCVNPSVNPTWRLSKPFVHRTHRRPLHKCAAGSADPLGKQVQSISTFSSIHFSKPTVKPGVPTAAPALPYLVSVCALLDKQGACQGNHRSSLSSSSKSSSSPHNYYQWYNRSRKGHRLRQHSSQATVRNSSGEPHLWCRTH
jgi:hypothetical protein